MVDQRCQSLCKARPRLLWGYDITKPEVCPRRHAGDPGRFQSHPHGPPTHPFVTLSARDTCVCGVGGDEGLALRQR